MMASPRSGNENREARRRKIVDRGSDRLALITGRVHNLPTSPPDSSSPLSLTNTPHRNPPSTPFSPVGEDGTTSGSTLQKSDYMSDSGIGYRELKAPAPEIRGRDEPVMRAETSKVRDSEISGRVQSSAINEISRSSSASTLGTGKGLEPRPQQQGFVSSSQIISAIKASETMRLYSSVAVALLVVLSHIGFPLLGCSLIKNMIGFRPLFLVLLTNVTIVVAQLLLDNPGAFQKGTGNKNPLSSDYGWAEHVSKALEVSFVMQKVMDAAFMDCSIYAVIVICGLVFT